MSDAQREADDAAVEALREAHRNGAAWLYGARQDPVCCIKNVLDAFDRLRTALADAGGELVTQASEVARAQQIASKYHADAATLALYLYFDKDHGSNGLLAKVHARAKSAEHALETHQQTLAALLDTNAVADDFATTVSPVGGF
jgi:hypothetical protein